MSHDRDWHGFGSDNHAGIHPEIIEAIAAANGGHVSAYGDDPYTLRFEALVRELFGGEARGFPVFNGTGANVVSLHALLPRWGGVIAAETAHINVDEAAAPERIAQTKLITVPTPDGKLTPALVEKHVVDVGDVHRIQPAVVSITQSTELGTLYTPDEIEAIADTAHGLGLKLHVDGSRISNAAASLGLPLRSFTTDAGADVLSLGGTKNGLLAAEAVVVLNPEVTGVEYLRKMDLQLASKLRFVSAQLVALYGTDLYLRSAGHANAMALKLRGLLEAIPGVIVTQPTQANGVFVVFGGLARSTVAALAEKHHFYEWDPARGEHRLMCAFDTTDADVEAFAADVKAAYAAA
ncbi:beta-eliminating lyase-related protein [Gryllotalpicola sp.]|uniref:threonine aldolase family protein n=1 Tax=Gryllotalpicola sp. TaxID=1932787 RepID=UPI00262BD0D5|nr:beta-eliminating lyase-related protein [Gryllotalpicola sp.]